MINNTDYLLKLLDEIKELLIAKNVAKKLKYNIHMTDGSTKNAQRIFTDMIDNRLLTAILINNGEHIPKYDEVYSLDKDCNLWDYLSGDAIEQNPHNSDRYREGEPIYFMQHEFEDRSKNCAVCLEKQKKKENE